MSRSLFDPPFERLPDALPVFPLTGALLLPGARLPLNIFEPRYLEMVDDALAGARMIGMIQPLEPADDNRGAAAGGADPALYQAGCAGRITGFSENDDGRYQIMLQGLIRFQVVEELAPKSYRRVRPDFDPFRGDLEDEAADLVDRETLLATLRDYFSAKSLEADWDSIEEADSAALVTTLAMACPLAPAEKQLLLEADGLAKRAEVLTAIMAMAVHNDEDAAPRH